MKQGLWEETRTFCVSEDAIFPDGDVGAEAPAEQEREAANRGFRRFTGGSVRDFP